MMGRVFIWALIAFLAFGAIAFAARAAEAWLKLWPVVRTGFIYVQWWGVLLVRGVRSVAVWWRARRRAPDIGLIYEPKRRLRR